MAPKSSKTPRKLCCPILRSIKDGVECRGAAVERYDGACSDEHQELLQKYVEPSAIAQWKRMVKLALQDADYVARAQLVRANLVHQYEVRKKKEIEENVMPVEAAILTTTNVVRDETIAWINSDEMQAHMARVKEERDKLKRTAPLKTSFIGLPSSQPEAGGLQIEDVPLSNIDGEGSQAADSADSRLKRRLALIQRGKRLKRNYEVKEPATTEKSPGTAATTSAAAAKPAEKDALDKSLEDLLDDLGDDDGKVATPTPSELADKMEI